MTDIPSATLNTGAKIPLVGVGCWMGIPGEGERAYNMCKNAIEIGYRHIDTAAGYGNEAYVGRAIRDSGVPRSEIFVTTKLPNHRHGAVRETFEESLAALNIQYIDLYLVHWPQASMEDNWFADALDPEETPTILETWAEMEKLLETGKVRAIGVSNFSIKNLERILASGKVVPAVNQVEMHPFLPQTELKEYCEAKGIRLTAYSPIGQPSEDSKFPSLLKNATITTLASKYNATPAQILLAWGVSRGTSVIPKSENKGRLRSNLTLINVDEEDIKVISGIHRQPGLHTSVVPYHADGKVFGWTYENLGWNFNNDGSVKS